MEFINTNDININIIMIYNLKNLYEIINTSYNLCSSRYRSKDIEWYLPPNLIHNGIMNLCAYIGIMLK